MENDYTPQTSRDELLSTLNSAFGSMFTVTYNQTSLRFDIHIEFQSQFQLFTDNELIHTTKWTGTAYDTHNLKSANEISSIYEPQQNTHFKIGIIFF